MHFGVPDPVIFGSLEIYRRPKQSRRKCPYRRHPRAAEQGEGLVAVHSSCERGAAPGASAGTRTGCSRTLCKPHAEEAPWIQAGGISVCFGKASSRTSALPSHTQTQSLILCLFPDSPSHRGFLDLLILPKRYSLALDRGGCSICEFT